MPLAKPHQQESSNRSSSCDSHAQSKRTHKHAGQQYRYMKLHIIKASHSMCALDAWQPCYEQPCLWQGLHFRFRTCCACSLAEHEALPLTSSPALSIGANSCKPVMHGMGTPTSLAKHRAGNPNYARSALHARQPPQYHEQGLSNNNCSNTYHELYSYDMLHTHTKVGTKWTTHEVANSLDHTFQAQMNTQTCSHKTTAENDYETLVPVPVTLQMRGIPIATRLCTITIM